MGLQFTGHYAPQLAELIYDRNKVKPKDSSINLKGFIVRIILLLVIVYIKHLLITYSRSNHAYICDY